MPHIVTAIPPLPPAALLALRTPPRAGQTAAGPLPRMPQLHAAGALAAALPGPGLRDMLQEDTFIFR